MPGLVVLALLHCGQDHPETAQTGSKQPPTQHADPPSQNPAINAIPHQQVRIATQPLALPLKPGGLRFQLDQSRTSETVTYFKPIGDAKFGPSGNLYVCFPTKHAVVRFNVPDFELQFFGQEQAGGRDEPIAHPNTLDFWDGHTLVTNTKKGQVMVFDAEFEMETLYQIHIQDPIPGPDRKFLIRSDKKPHLFFRSDQNNHIEHYYMVPLNQSLPNQAQILHFAIQPNWDLAAVTTGATDLYHIRKDGTFKRHFSLDFSPIFDGKSLQVHQLQLDGDAYWLLLSEGGKITYLFAITLDGKPRFAWILPFLCDGFHLGLERMVIFNREEAKAQVFFR